VHTVDIVILYTVIMTSTIHTQRLFVFPLQQWLRERTVYYVIRTLCCYFVKNTWIINPIHRGALELPQASMRQFPYWPVLK